MIIRSDAHADLLFLVIAPKGITYCVSWASWVKKHASGT